MTIYIVFDTSIDTTHAFASYKEAEDYFEDEIVQQMGICSIIKDIDNDPKEWKPDLIDGGVTRRSAHCTDMRNGREYELLLIEVKVKE